MVDLYPPIESFARGLLDVGDGNQISYEIAGNPHGKPAVVLHGGPGQGSAPGMRRAFDPTKYRVVLFDQRGCGRSTPHASDPATDMTVNTTAHLASDMDVLRKHLGIERWLVSGGSWGVTLALAYALKHPERVSALVLSSITTSRRSEADWLYHGVSRFFPESFERFCEHVSETRAEALIEAYAQRLAHPDFEVRIAAARAWCAWEDAVLSLEAQASAAAPLDDASCLAFARICTHYLRHGAFLEEGALIREAAKLGGIPCVLIHGRRDLSCPMSTAYELARALPGAELVALDDAGHLGSPSKREALMRALARFAD